MWVTFRETDHVTFPSLMNGTSREGTKGIGPKEVTNASKLVGSIGSQDTVRSRRDCAFARGGAGHEGSHIFMVAAGDLEAPVW